MRSSKTTRLLAVALALLTVAVVESQRPGASSSARPSEHVRSQLPARLLAQRYVFPLKVSHNRRYLVDQRSAPFLIVGDSPQALVGNLSVADAGFYIENRRKAGFNALWINLLCAKYTGCREDGATFDGIQPFTKPGDLSTPNPVYFARVDRILRVAAKAGIVVFLNPIETGGWLSVLKDNGVAKARAYGRFLGRRYRSFGNIVWMSGNDFQTWQDEHDDALVLGVARGIRSEDPNHLQTIELNYLESGSRDDPRWRSIIQLDAAYTYHPTYARVLREYNRRPFMPVFMVEAGYEFEQNISEVSKGDPPILRRQEYWTMLSGGAGQLYGNHYTWQFADGWRDHLDTRGSAQLGYLVKLFRSVPWFRLVPDQSHRIVTSGYGTFAASGNVGSSNYVTAAATPDRRLTIAYLPNGGTVTVDARALRRPVRAQWYDPTSGKYERNSARLKNGGRVRLTAPTSNADGDADWVLVLRAD